MRVRKEPLLTTGESEVDMKKSMIILTMLLCAVLIALPAVNTALASWQEGSSKTLGTASGSLGTGGSYDSAAVDTSETVPL